MTQTLQISDLLENLFSAYDKLAFFPAATCLQE